MVRFSYNFLNILSNDYLYYSLCVLLAVIVLLGIYLISKVEYAVLGML